MDSKNIFFIFFTLVILFNNNLRCEMSISSAVINNYEIENVSLDSALYSLSVNYKYIPMGFATSSLVDVSTNKYSIKLINKTVGEILDEIKGFDNKYTWQEKEGVIDIIINDESIISFLNKPIDKYECKNGNKITIINEISKQYLDNMLELQIGNDIMEIDEIIDKVKTSQEVANEVMNRFKNNNFSRKYNINLKNVTLLDILNYIVKEDKNYMWILWKGNGDSKKMFLTFVKIDERGKRKSVTYSDGEKMIWNYEVPNFKVEYNSVFDICYALCNQIEDLKMGIQMLQTTSLTDKKILELKNTTVGTILENIIKIYPSYEWYKYSNVICLKPKEDNSQLNEILETIVENVDAHNLTLKEYYDTLLKCSKLNKFKIDYSYDEGLSNRILFFGADKISFRNILNNTIARYNDLMWIIEGKEDKYLLKFVKLNKKMKIY